MYCYVPADTYLISNVTHVYTNLYRGMYVSKSYPNLVNHFQNQAIPIKSLVTFRSLLFSGFGSVFGENFNIVLVS